VVAGGTIYHKQGRYGLAEAEFNKALALKPAFPPAVFARALSRLAAGRFGAAAEDFARAQGFSTLEASDYVPLWLYIARGREGRLDLAFLDLAGKQPDPSTWPGALLAFYRGQLTEAAVRKAAVSADMQTDRSQRCEADFYIAEWRLLNREKEAARRLFENATGECPHSSAEYEMATIELKRLLTKAALAQQPAAQ
jgi:lipoprotein NlpI